MISGFLRSFSANKVVRNFIICDLLLFGGWGLISPIMSIFAIQTIPGVTLVTVGSLAAIYWIVRSLVEMPIAILIERTEGEKDDLYVLITGLILISISAFWLVISKTVTHLYIFQSIHAIGFGFYSASWAGIFSRHIEKKKESSTWSLDHVVLGIATGVTGAIGGYLTERYGFNFVFALVGILSLLSAVIVFMVPDIILPNRNKEKSLGEPDHSPHSIAK